MSKRYITLREVTNAAEVCARHVHHHTLANNFVLYGVPRGGFVPALLVARFLEGLGAVTEITDDPNRATVIIDDLIDSGATRSRYLVDYPQAMFRALFEKVYPDEWFVFPWEGDEAHDNSATDIPIRLLQYIGEDPYRGGLLETPARFLKAWDHWTSGYKQDPADVLKVFEDGAENYDEMILVSNIPVHSKCEHHAADIFGLAHVAYIPDGRIVGLSKLSRVVDIFARRLQVQERMTAQIADALNDNLEPLGVGVVLQCRHACMESRGISVSGTITTTSAMRGVFRTEPATRAEFLQLIDGARNGVHI